MSTMKWLVDYSNEDVVAELKRRGIKLEIIIDGSGSWQHAAAADDIEFRTAAGHRAVVPLAMVLDATKNIHSRERAIALRNNPVQKALETALNLELAAIRRAIDEKGPGIATLPRPIAEGHYIDPLDLLADDA